MTLVIHEAAEDDILRQVGWYAERGVPDVARRFYKAVFDAVDAVVAMPSAGLPKVIANSRLVGLRTWPVRGFDEFRIYYLQRPEALTVLRVLHGKRDIGTLLETRDFEGP